MNRKTLVSFWHLNLACAAARLRPSARFTYQAV